MTVLRYSPAAEQGFFSTLLCSLGVHLLILLLWMLWPGPPAQLATRVLMVRIIPEVQPVPVAAAAPRPAPVLTRPRQQPHPFPPATTALPAPPAPPATTQVADPAATVTLPAETATDAAPLAAAAAEPPVTLAVAAADTPPNATTTTERDVYLQALRQRIEAHRDYPLLARKGRQQGRAIVRFRLDRQGILCEAWLAVPSGSSLLDRAALRAVAEAAPFPPLPAGLDTAATFDAPVTFRLDR